MFLSHCLAFLPRAVAGEFEPAASSCQHLGKFSHSFRFEPPKTICIICSDFPQLLPVPAPGPADFGGSTLLMIFDDVLLFKSSAVDCDYHGKWACPAAT